MLSIFTWGSGPCAAMLGMLTSEAKLGGVLAWNYVLGPISTGHVTPRNPKPESQLTVVLFCRFLGRICSLGRPRSLSTTAKQAWSMMLACGRHL